MTSSPVLHGLAVLCVTLYCLPWSSGEQENSLSGPSSGSLIFPGLFVDKSNIPGAGRGVFAAEAIKAEQVVESCWTVKIPLGAARPNAMMDYVWAYDTAYDSKSFGYCAVYNHQQDNSLYNLWMPPAVPQQNLPHFVQNVTETLLPFEFNGDILGPGTSQELPEGFPYPFTTNGDHRLVANRDIEPGQELYVSYGADWLKDRGIEALQPLTGLENRGSRCQEGEQATELGKCTPVDGSLGIQKPPVRIGRSKIPGAGRGAFLLQPKKAGELVEKVLVLLVPYMHIARSLAANYVFRGKGQSIALLALGYATMYNHDSKNPNLVVRWASTPHHPDHDTPDSSASSGDGPYYLEFKALRDILEGEELTLDYGKDWERDWALYTANLAAHSATNGPSLSKDIPQFFSPIRPPPELLERWPESGVKGLNSTTVYRRVEADPTTIDHSLYLDDSTIPGAGRGAFLGRNYDVWEPVERCPTILAPNRAVSKNVLLDNVWEASEGSVCITLGFCMIWNHQEKPTLQHVLVESDVMSRESFIEAIVGQAGAEVPTGLILPFSVEKDYVMLATTELEKDQEGFVSYGDDWFGSRDLGAEGTEEVSQAKPKRPTTRAVAYPQVYLNTSTIPGAGRGVFSKRTFRAGEIVEIAPTRILPYQHLKGSTVENHVFRKGSSPVTVLTAGFGAFYNHDLSGHNLRLQWFDLQEMKLSHSVPELPHLAFVASRDIAAGEELLITYGKDWEQAWETYRAYLRNCVPAGPDSCDSPNFYHTIGVPAELEWPTYAVGMEEEVHDPGYSPHCSMYVGLSSIPGAHRGIFAGRDLREGEVVASCPNILVPYAACSDTELLDHVLHHSDTEQMLMLGYCVMVNHGSSSLDASNLLYQMEAESPNVNDNVLPSNASYPSGFALPFVRSPHVLFKTTKPGILKGQELLVTFGDAWADARGLPGVHPVLGNTPPEPLFGCPQLELKPSRIAGAGRGVFATADFRAGEVVEVVPVLLAHKSDLQLHYSLNYAFVKEGSEVAVFPLGYGALYNHASKPLLEYFWTTPESQKEILDLGKHKLEGGRLYLGFRALQPIKTGQELTIDYGAGWQTAYNQWLRDTAASGANHEISFKPFFHGVQAPQHLSWPETVNGQWNKEDSLKQETITHSKEKSEEGSVHDEL